MQSADEIEIVENEDYYVLEDGNDQNEFESEDNYEEDLNIDIVDKSILTFNLHSKSVFCCSLTNDSTLAVSGGEDDKAYVWRTEDGHLKFECNGHEDSVIEAKFNCNSKLLATGDMRGMIKIWNVESGNCIGDFEMEELTWLEWHPALENVFLYGTSEGNCYLNRMKTNDNEIKIMSGNTSALNGLILNDGKRSVVGYENGDVRLWDLKNCSTTYCVKENDLDNQITALAVKSDNSLIATGFLNSKLKLINLSTGRILFENKKENCEELNSIESLVFCNSLSILAVGYLDGEIDLWDLSSGAFIKRDSIKLDNGITKLVLDSNQDHLLYASSIDGTIRLFDIRDLKQLNEFTGHRKDVLDFIISKQNNFILSCSDDSTCKLFKID